MTFLKINNNNISRSHTAALKAKKRACEDNIAT